MLVDYRPSWRLILAQVGRVLLAELLFSVAICFVYYRGYRFTLFAVPDLPLTLLGTVLGLLLGFRTNSAYSRWWEARTLWGGIINQSRNWARQVLTMPDAGGASYGKELVYAQIAFVHTLRRHLRGQDPFEGITSLLSPPVLERLRTQGNVPAALLHIMGERTCEMFRQGVLGENRFVALQSTVSELTNLQGGCERIHNTPLPRQYDYWPAAFVYAYCFLFPLAVVQELGWYTPLLTLFVGFIFLVLNRVGRNLEDPFHSPVYGTPMTALCRTIENNLREQLGEATVLPPLAPIDGVLE